MKSFYKLLSILIIINISQSCSTSSSASDELHSDAYVYLSPESVVYASTISNLVSTFPKFRNDAVNREVAGLKKSLTNYLLAVRNLHQSEKTKSLE